MAEESMQVKFDFDAKEAMGKIGELTEKLGAIGSIESFESLVGSMSRAMGPLALLTASVYALKKVMDFAIEGEQIERINKQFESLAVSAGLAAGELKESIEAAKGPMVGMDEALTHSSEAIVKLGAQATKIPEIFELSRRVAKVFGGEVTDRFDQITQAISTGNQRLVKTIGLNVDLEAVTRKYAASVGQTVNTLTEAQKQQAYLNAILDTGEKKFSAISLQSDTLGDKTKSLRVSFQEFGESLSKLATKLSPILTPAVEMWTNMVDKMTKYLDKNSGIDAQREKLKALTEEAAQLQKKVDGLDRGGKLPLFLAWDLDSTVTRLANVKGEIAQIQQAIGGAEGKGPDAGAEARTEIAAEESSKRNEKILAEENKFAQSLNAIRQGIVADEAKNITESQEAYRNHLEQMRLLDEQYALKLKQIQIEKDEHGTLTESQAAKMTEQIQEERFLKLKALSEREKELDQQVADNRMRLARTTGEQISAGLEQRNVEIHKDLTNWGKLAVNFRQVAANNIAGAFRDIGSGAKTGAKAMEDVVKGMVATMADAYGRLLIETGLWPVNPIALAAGAALLALSGALGGSSGSGGSAGVGMAPGPAGGGTIGADMSRPNLEAQKGKTVTLQVMGHYFETAETQRTLMNMIRSETDATTFQYQQIGVK